MLLPANAPLLYGQQPAQRGRWLNELSNLIAFPTVSAQPRHLPVAARWLKQHLARLGLANSQILPGINRGQVTALRQARVL